MYTSESSSYLNTHSLGTRRYLEWFGAFYNPRYTTVKNHFGIISNATTNAGITFDCGRKQNYYS